uniref:Uncharacterized protein n=1 Tax=Timema tahoe TaxID=61484 RepID=A0A7R9FFQ0_9NEOP|nr:unnamed protein product [Timema tahoe]
MANETSASVDMNELSQPVTENRTMKALLHLPERPLIDIEFNDLTYTIPYGRKDLGASPNNDRGGLEPPSRLPVGTLLA